LAPAAICDDRAVVLPGAGRPADKDGAARGMSPGLVGSLDRMSPSIHQSAWIAPGAVIIGAVSIGPRSSVWYGSVLRADEDDITIGEECNIQDLCCIHVDPGEPAVIESRVSLGHHATVHGAHVAEGALIGMGAIVLGGARIGPAALIAAGTVVLPRVVVPGGVLFAGVPGRVIRELNAGDHERLGKTSRGYVERAVRHREARWQDPPAG
jgi:carbonic anhydrase/acetyltransferase-like protein (isoleucine patch superfamily)